MGALVSKSSPLAVHTAAIHLRQRDVRIITIPERSHIFSFYDAY